MVEEEGGVERVERKIVSLPLLSHEHVLERRRRRNRKLSDTSTEAEAEEAAVKEEEEEDSMNVDALYQGFGTHYIDVWVGTPPQRQTVIVDTGSSIAAFPCSPGCDAAGESCGRGYHIDSPFPTTTSSTFDAVPCEQCKLTKTCRKHINSGGPCPLFARYMEGSSWTAYEASDWVYLGGFHDHPLSLHSSTPNEDQFGQDKEIVVDSFQHNSTANQTNQSQQQQSQGDQHQQQQDLLRADEKLQHPYSKTGEDPNSALQFRFPLHFGCQTKLTGLFQTQLADGIMGMDNSPLTAWSQATRHLGLRPAFALCFSHQPNVDATANLPPPAGALTFGGVDGNLHSSQMIFAKNINKSGWYTVYVNQLHWLQGYTNPQSNTKKKNKKSKNKTQTNNNNQDQDSPRTIVRIDATARTVNSGFQGVIVDSGTTDTFLDKRLFDPLKQAWEQLTSIEFPWSNLDERGHSYAYLTDDELLSLPTLSLQLAAYEGGDHDEDHHLYANRNEPPPIVSHAGPDYDTQNPDDVILQIPPWRYLGLSSTSSASSFIKTHKKKKKSQRLYRARIHLEKARQGGVIGANAMMGHDIYFDMEHARIGFANSWCDYNALANPSN